MISDDDVGLDVVSLSAGVPVRQRVCDEFRLNTRVDCPTFQGASHHGVNRTLIAERHALCVRSPYKEGVSGPCPSDWLGRPCTVEQGASARKIVGLPIPIHELTQSCESVRLNSRCCVAAQLFEDVRRVKDAKAVPGPFSG